MSASMDMSSRGAGGEPCVEAEIDREFANAPPTPGKAGRG